MEDEERRDVGVFSLPYLSGLPSSVSLYFSLALAVTEKRNGRTGRGMEGNIKDGKVCGDVLPCTSRLPSLWPS